MRLTFVVNGEPVSLEARSNEILQDAVFEVLGKSKNLSRKLNEWELRYENGVLISDWLKPVGAYGFFADACLYLTLPVGHDG